MSTESVQTKTPLPWVTLILILANLVASLLTTVAPDLALEFAFNPRNPSVVGALSSLFMHSNLVHLLGNMVFLAAVGPKVESVAGKLSYALIYFVGGLTSVAAHWAVITTFSGSLPLLGASGAIAACAGYCAVRFMNRKVPLAPRVSVTVGTVTLIWVALQAVGSFVKFGSTVGGAAYWTHLAGFMAGLLLSLLFKAPDQARLQFGHEVLDQMSERSAGALLRAAESHLARHPDDPRALREMASALHQMGDREHEAKVLAKLLETQLQSSPERILQELVDIDGLSAVAAMQRLKIATLIQPRSPDMAKALLRSVSEDPSAAELKPDALVALAEVSQDEEREALLRELQSRYALHPATALARAKGLFQ